MRQRKRLAPDVAITRNFDEGQAIVEGLNILECNDLINESDVVVITPNWVNQDKPDPKQGVVVGPESLRTIIQYVKENKPKRIVIATGSGGYDTSDVMKKVGYDKIINDEQVEFVDLNKGEFVDLTLNHDVFQSTKINKLIEEVTVLISFTQLKNHEEATMSAAIKNIALAWPPADVHGHPKKDLGIHTNLHGFIRAMAEKIAIDISIVSANPAMIGSGPTNGISKHTGLVISGTDPVSVDVVGARLLGFKPQAINYLYQLANNDTGVSDINNINIKGLTIQEAENAFSESVYGQSIVIDKKN